MCHRVLGNQKRKSEKGIKITGEYFNLKSGAIHNSFILKSKLTPKLLNESLKTGGKILILNHLIPLL
jgi:hypothetical protein